MPKPCVLLSGPTLALDDPLVQELQKHVTALKCRKHAEIAAILETARVDILLLEITTESTMNLKIIKTIKRNFPHLKIIVVNGNGNRKALARAFASGAKDAFSKSYDRTLLVERIQALLR